MSLELLPIELASWKLEIAVAFCRGLIANQDFKLRFEVTALPDHGAPKTSLVSWIPGCSAGVFYMLQLL